MRICFEEKVLKRIASKLNKEHKGAGKALLSILEEDKGVEKYYNAIEYND